MVTTGLIPLMKLHPLEAFPLVSWMKKQKESHWQTPPRAWTSLAFPSRALMGNASKCCGVDTFFAKLVLNNGFIRVVETHATVPCAAKMSARILPNDLVVVGGLRGITIDPTLRHVRPVVARRFFLTHLTTLWHDQGLMPLRRRPRPDVCLPPWRMKKSAKDQRGVSGRPCWRIVATRMNT